jgi:hypothetical protein
MEFKAKLGSGLNPRCTVTLWLVEVMFNIYFKSGKNVKLVEWKCWVCVKGGEYD